MTVSASKCIDYCSVWGHPVSWLRASNCRSATDSKWVTLTRCAPMQSFESNATTIRCGFCACAIDVRRIDKKKHYGAHPSASSLALLRGRTVPNRLIASGRMEGRGVQVASYIMSVLRSRNPAAVARAPLRQLPGIAALCNRTKRPPRADRVRPSASTAALKTAP
jgi:hypothetical protein